MEESLKDINSENNTFRKIHTLLSKFRFTSDSELDVLEADRAVLTNSKQDNESQSLSNGRHQQRIPYKQMLTDSSMWACLSAGTGSALAYYFFALYGPTYMNKVRHLLYNNFKTE